MCINIIALNSFFNVIYYHWYNDNIIEVNKYIICGNNITLTLI